MEREVMWASFDGDGFEHVRLTRDGEMILADGLIIHLEETGSYRLRYRIHSDEDWRVRKVELASLDSEERRLVITSDGEGHWKNQQGENIASLQGCRDLDIYASPFTNTLAIRRLRLKEGESSKIHVAFIKIPEFDLIPVAQRYSLLRRLPQGGEVYRYEGLDSGFTVELPVDPDGLVIDYPGLSKRIWSR